VTANPFLRMLAGMAALVTGGAVIFYALVSTSPLPDHPLLYGHNDLVMHVLAFIALSTIVLVLGYGWHRSVAGLILLAGAIELAQIFLPDRSADWLDFAGSVTGIALAAILAGGLRRIAARLAAKETDCDE
jgi:VanZ family protein